MAMCNLVHPIWYDVSNKVRMQTTFLHFERPLELFVKCKLFRHPSLNWLRFLFQHTNVFPHKPLAGKVNFQLLANKARVVIF